MAECEDSQSSPDFYAFLGKRVYGTWGIALVLLACASAVPALLSVHLWISSAVMALVAAVFVVICAVLMVGRSLVTPLAPRLAAVVCAAGSLAVALVSLLSRLSNIEVGPQFFSAAYSVSRLWITAGVSALVILLIVGFGFEMARQVRTRLIESLSVVVAAGVAGWCAGGWVFLPVLIAQGSITMVVASVVLVLVSGVLCSVIPWVAHRLRKNKELVTSVGDEEFTNEDAQQLSTIPYSADARKLSVALGILPIILSGALVPLMLLAQSLMS